MEYFWTDAGNNRPKFIYRLKVKNCTAHMYNWSINYPAKGPFSRFHVEWSKMDDGKDYDVIQFELRDAYLAFKYAFAGEFLEDITWKEFQ